MQEKITEEISLIPAVREELPALKVDLIKAFGKFCADKGYPFTVDSCPGDEHFDMGDASGHFTYLEDPDGTLLEFVETEKIPVAKKLGWYIDMTTRNPEKVLPKFLFKLIGLVSREKTK